MRRLAVVLGVLLGAAAGARADDLAFFVHQAGTTPDGPTVGNSYAFPAVAVGDASSITLRIRNTASATAYVIVGVFSQTADFPVSNSATYKCVAPGGNDDLTLAFQPHTTGAASGLIRVLYAGFPASTGCPASLPGNPVESDILVTGSGIAAQWTVTYASGTGAGTPIASGDTIAFGNVPVNTSASLRVTVTNTDVAPLTMPAVSLPAGTLTNAFSLSGVPASTVQIAPGASASFSVQFTPGQQALAQGTLTIGPRQYTLTGFGVLGAGSSSLVVAFTDPTGVRSLLQGATGIAFGNVPVGSSSVFIITVTNPANSDGAVTLGTVSVSGSGYSLNGQPASTLNPGAQTTFQIAFAPQQSGASNGLLVIGGWQIPLSATGADAETNFPGLTIQLDTTVLYSQQQAHVSVHAATPLKATLLPKLTIAFQSGVAGIADDSAIFFLDANARSIGLQIASGTTDATFNAKTQFGFQTGTTAGRIVFTLTLPDNTTKTASFDIAPAVVKLTASSAIVQDPNIVVTLTGFDNTYSAKRLTYTFFDAKSNSITPNGIVIDASQAFHNYFFTGNPVAGSTFSVQAKFPVTGDIRKIGAVDVAIDNAQGTTKLIH